MNSFRLLTVVAYNYFLFLSKIIRLGFLIGFGSIKLFFCKRLYFVVISHSQIALNFGVYVAFVG